MARIPLIRFAQADLHKLMDWFQDVGDGILETQDVLDACDGHQENGPIREKAAALSNLGIDTIQAVCENEWTHNEVLLEAVLDQVKEDCEDGDVTAVHELLELGLKGETPFKALLEGYLRDDTLNAINL